MSTSAGARPTMRVAAEKTFAAMRGARPHGIPLALFIALCTATATAATAASPVAAAPHASAFSRAEVARIDRLLSLIQARLERAPAQADMRWRSMSRIEDPAAERQLLDSVRKTAEALRLDAELATAFAQAQIDAGKIIQAERHKQWAAAGAAAPPREKVANPLHATTAEPEFGAPMLKAWRDVIPVLKKRDARAILDARAADLIHVGGPDLMAARVALAPLYDIANQNRNGNAK